MLHPEVSAQALSAVHLRLLSYFRSNQSVIPLADLPSHRQGRPPRNHLNRDRAGLVPLNRQTVASGSVVYLPVALKEGRFLQRVMRIGEDTGRGLRVLEGPTQGDTVVSEGSVLLRAESLRQHPQ
jgi:hypothetical protein